MSRPRPSLRRVTWLALLCALPLLLSERAAAGDSIRTVNRVLGDASYLVEYGHAPSAQTDEVDRIQTHLAHVERILRRRDVTHWDIAAQQARAQNLDRLRDYWMQGEFPSLSTADGRRPRLVDPAGRLCAVAYLFAETNGLAAAETLSERHEFDWAQDIDAPALLSWARVSGLTPTELAMIQPTYRKVKIKLESRRARNYLVGHTRSVNRCIHDNIDAWTTHPRNVDVVVDVDERGAFSLAELVMKPRSEKARACIHRTIGGLHLESDLGFVNELLGLQWSFRIITPLTSTGDINPNYLPLVFKRARKAAHACVVRHRAATTKPPRETFALLVNAEFSRTGRARLLQAHVNRTPADAQLHKCLDRALGQQRTPRYQRDDDAAAERASHFYALVMPNRR